MKKIICLLLCPLFFIISGCNKKGTDITPVTKGIMFTAKANFDGESYEYSVKISNEGVFEITSLTTNATYIINKNSLKIKYGDLEYSVNTTDLPDNLVKLVCSAMISENNTVYCEEDEYFFSVKNQEYNITVYTGQSGLPIKLYEKSNDITIEFYNVSLL